MRRRWRLRQAKISDGSARPTGDAIVTRRSTV
jgi:hypothetical protein